ncbi:MAG TPA: glycosyltransferase [Puia sp.]|nr:glycosyltransferase [Puia sp.]
MFVLKVLFFTGFFVIFYSYIGYGCLVWLLLGVRNFFRPSIRASRRALIGGESTALPAVTLIIAAYNEADFIVEKIENSLALEYPAEKLEIIFVTDGSTDETPQIAARYDRIRVLHSPERKGKVAAMHRAMGEVRTPIVVFSDANTLLNKESIFFIARHYHGARTGGVAGEKKVMPAGDVKTAKGGKAGDARTIKGAKGGAAMVAAKGKVAGIGEGLYWKYESFLKRLDSDLFTVVGAAGELFSIRTELYEPPGPDVLLDDFIISLRICARGYRVQYEPAAFAMETPSSSLKEERKRKIRISAGAFQSMVMLKELLNPFQHPLLSFQYISHRVLRWTLCPLFLPIILVLNILLFATEKSSLFGLLLIAQLIFYATATAGWLLANRNIKSKLLYVPYYFLFLNISLYQGYFRYKKGQQSVLWEKAVRERKPAGAAR